LERRREETGRREALAEFEGALKNAPGRREALAGAAELVGKQ
jgi:hypothetical protein